MKTVYYIYDCCYPTKAVFNEGILNRIKHLTVHLNAFQKKYLKEKEFVNVTIVYGTTKYKYRKDKAIEMIPSCEGPILHYGSNDYNMKCEDDTVWIKIGTEGAWIESDEQREPHFDNKNLLTIPDLYFTKSFIRQYSNPSFYGYNKKLFKDIIKDMPKEHKIKLKELHREKTL